MKRRYPLAFLLICGALAATAVAPTGCSTAERPDARTMFVTIAPLRTLVETIVGDDFRVEVLVPDGASPETFEPTPRQFIALNEARKVFSVGLLDFETALTARLADTSALVPLARGIETIAGSCSHAHPTHRHAHGVDPHVWTSPRELGIMASNAYEAIRRTFPDSAKYERNYLELKRRIEELDAETADRIARSGLRSFIVYHPALTYYARAYGLEQLAIESEGKEPSARRLTELIRRARTEGVCRIFYQRQYPVTVVATVAEDIGATPVEFDPLREDPIANIRTITDLLTEEP
ncbi:zinc ABC transporter substrate-binding protein [uncultured Alistipes sp.]|uniref:metal ABC transporter solute-binding protein, Zn/Mn family n=1 Tax=uncultured Alistipes sp. TaxID=538949 RepID=UPI0026351976|nr:zinc ABC transporter substrate-binding protein [uncultured Alistipes sp.]